MSLINKQPQIIELLKDEDDKTIRDLYNEYKPGFLLFANKYPISKESILDIYQDAIVALCENAKKGKLESINSTLKTYFFAIGKYMVYAKLKKEQHTIDYKDLEDTYFEWEEIDENNDEELKLLGIVFSQLGEQCQEILKLFYYEEKKLDDITQLMKYENKDVAKSQKHRCLKTLRQLTEKRKSNG